MRAKTLVAAVAAVAFAVVPTYTVEKFTEFLFLTSSPDFFTWSGLRLELFIISILLGAVAAGLINEGFLVAFAGYLLGIVILLCLFNVFCNPRVCFSVGLDGLEPLRMGSFFSCLAIVGIAAGNFRRTKVALSDRSALLLFSVSIIAISYYPVIFTIAGARLLTPLAPAPLLALVFLLALAFGAKVSRSYGWKAALALPLLSQLLVLAISLGIALQYLLDVVPIVALIVLATIAGAAAGLLIHRKKPSFASRHLVRSNRLPLALVLLVLVMMVVVLPDVANGAAPASSNVASSDSSRVFPVYVGGFMANDFLRPTGVAVTVSFSGTDPSTIQSDNFLSAGLGVHSPNCCVDGIDYGYRSDVFLYHNGSEMLAASAWRICDFNMACGGHSWQDLMYFWSQPLTSATVSSKVNLTLRWENETAVWTYAVDGGRPETFAMFDAPEQENPYFNVGTLGNVLANPESAGTFFYQYGMMSRYPLGHAGWSVNFACPSYLAANDTWVCVRHSEAMQGDQSYWKALWRWGESYQGAAARANATSNSVTFFYSEPTISDFVRFW